MNLHDAALVLAAVIALVWAVGRFRRARPQRPPLSTELEIVLSLAAHLAARRGALVVQAEDVLIAALESPGVAEVFRRAGFEPGSLAAAVTASMRPLLSDRDPRIDEAFRAAWSLAREAGRHAIDVSDLLLALSSSESLRGWLGGLRFDEPQLVTVTTSVEDHEGFLYVWNDDTTPMESVVAIFERVFGMPSQEAIYRMLTVHHRGHVPLGPYPATTLTSLLEQATIEAERQGIPLKLTIDPPDTLGWRRDSQHGFLPE